MKYIIAAKDHDPNKPNYDSPVNGNHNRIPNSEIFFECKVDWNEYRRRFPATPFERDYYKEIPGPRCIWNRDITKAKTFDTIEEAQEYKMNVWKIDYDHIYIKPIES